MVVHFKLKRIMNSNTLKSDLKRLKMALIVSTLIQIAYFGVIFTNDKLWIKLDYDFKANYVIGSFHIIVMIIFLWYNWKKMPIEKSKKKDNTYMILFLGIIGMWLWMPSKKQIEKMNTTHNNASIP